MKLIRRTYFLTSLWLLPITLIGSLFCFFMIEYIAYEETDEFLTYEMERLVAYHTEHNDLPEYHKVADIIPGKAYTEPVFKDTMMLESGDNEMVPYRELFFTINHKGENFTIVLRHLLLGRDDIAEGSLLIMVGVLFLMVSFLILVLNVVARKIWNPFYNTLQKVSGYKIGTSPPALGATQIDEFTLLNKTLTLLLRKIDSDFKRNKEFTENLSHELQTHLAIIRTTTENLLNQPECKNDRNIQGLKSIYTSVTKLHQVQKSLMLLSKISNREFVDAAHINLAHITGQILENFSEAFEMRQIEVLAQLNDCTVEIDAGLAEILMGNLIKNALKHNVANGYMKVETQPGQMLIENTGQPYASNPEYLFKRFHKGENGNYGIGLSIVKQICELYNYSISYHITEKNIHKITVSFR